MLGLPSIYLAAADVHPSSPGKDPFEGEVTLRVRTHRGRETREVRVLVRGDRERYDLPAGEAIVDEGQRQMILVRPADRTYAVAELGPIAAPSKPGVAPLRLPASWSARGRPGELQVVEVVPRAVDASEFAPPEGYSRVELPREAFDQLLPAH